MPRYSLAIDKCAENGYAYANLYTRERHQGRRNEVARDARLGTRI